MACKIVWTQRAIDTYLQNNAYLQENWPPSVRENFDTLLKKKLEILVHHPELGRKTRSKGIYKTLIHKRVTLIYAYRKKMARIELLYFWNTYMQPPKNIKQIRKNKNQKL